MKKFLKVLGVIVLVLVLALAGFVAYNWQMVQILTNDAEVAASDGSSFPEPPDVLPEVNVGEADWPNWRGPDSSLRSGVQGISQDWTGGLPLVWSVDYLCQGRSSAVWSAPVVQGNRLVVCGRADAEKDSSKPDRDLVFCLNAETGQLLWHQSYASEAGASYGSGFRATPIIFENYVYTFGRGGDLVCWSLFDGEELWRQNVNKHGGQEPQWGHSTSPLIHGDLIVLNGGGAARTLAFNRLSGELAWKSGEGEAGYAALTRMQIGDRWAILTFHGTGLAALDSESGKLLWDVEWKTPYHVNATTPLVEDQEVFISSGYKTGSQKLTAAWDGVEIQWTQDVFAAHHSDPILLDGYIYGYSGDSMQNRGTFICLDWKSGEIQWESKEIGWGTTVFVDGFLLCADIKGNLALIRPNPNAFELVDRFPNAIPEVNDAAWTTPAVANGKLYLRYKQKLLCYELK